VVEGTQRVGALQILNEFDLARMELGGPASGLRGRSGPAVSASLIEEPLMPAGPNSVSSSIDAYAFERVMAKIGAIEQQLGSKANRGDVRKIGFIFAIMTLLSAALVAGAMLTYLMYVKGL
jgi:hypothetical protein